MRVVGSGQPARGPVAWWKAWVGHDIRTPLTVLMGYLELMAQDLDSPNGVPLNVNGHYRRIVEVMLRNVRHLYTTLEWLMAMSDLNLDNLEASFEPVLLVDIINERWADWEAWVKEAGFRFEITVMPPIPYILGNATLIRQAMDILVKNAIRHCEPRRPAPDDWYTPVPKVRLYLWYGPGRFSQFIQFAVIDEGEPVPQEHLKRLMSIPLEEATEEEAPVVLCRTIVEKHRGRVWFTNRTAGPGNIFLIAFPPPPTKAQAAAQSTTSESAS